jgi:MFS family permease
VPRLPEIKAAAALGDGAYGAGIGAFSVGALLAGLAAAWLIARLGSARVTVVSAVVSGLLLATPALADAWLPFAAAVLLIGGLDSTMDVAMNAHGLRVQRALGRSVLQGMHAWWSIGAVLGGAIGALVASLGVAPAAHLLAAGIVLALIALAAGVRLLSGPDPTAVTPTAAARRPLLAAGRGVALVGAFVVFAAIVEDAPGSWSGVHLREDLAVVPGFAGAAYVAFMVAMTAARLVGDRVVDRFGAATVVRGGGLLAAIALGIGLAVDTPASVVIAFAILGVGAAPAFPAAFTAAERLPGLSPGAGVAAVSLIGRSGFLLAPILVGLIADAASLRAALVVTVAASLAVVATAVVLRPRGS